MMGKTYKDLREKLAASIYRQGEQSKDRAMPLQRLRIGGVWPKWFLKVIRAF